MKRYTSLLFFIICFFSAKSQCVDGNCENGFGKRWFTKHDSVFYVGNFKDKYPDGSGTAKYRNGKRYEGQWLHGMWHGDGKLILSDGQIISGVWEYSRLKTAKELISITPNDNLLASRTNNAQKQNANPVKTSSTDFEEPHFKNETTQEIIKPRVNFVPTKTETKTPEIWALAVGVAEYQDQSVPVLKYSTNDAFRMFAFWMSQQGGSLDEDHARVIVDDAATKKMVVNNMNELFSKAEPEDMVIFFFSGHGLVGSFLTTDYDGVDLQLRHREINALLAKCQARHKLVIADACFAGSYVTSKGTNSRPNATEMNNKFYGEIQKSESGTAYLLSCTNEEESLEVNTLHDSVFTHFVLKGLKGAADTNGDKIITVQELFNYVHKNVSIFAANLGKTQTPVLKGNYDPNMPVAILK